MRFVAGWGGQSGLGEALRAGREAVPRKIHWLRRSGKRRIQQHLRGWGLAFRGVCTEDNDEGRRIAVSTPFLTETQTHNANVCAGVDLEACISLSVVLPELPSFDTVAVTRSAFVPELSPPRVPVHTVKHALHLSSSRPRRPDWHLSIDRRNCNSERTSPSSIHTSVS